MDERTFRQSITKEELEKRAYIIPFKVYDVETLENLSRYSEEFQKTWDDLINAAIKKFISDIEAVHRLRH